MKEEGGKESEMEIRGDRMQRAARGERDLTKSTFACVIIVTVGVIWSQVVIELMKSTGSLSTHRHRQKQEQSGTSIKRAYKTQINKFP